MHAQPGLVRLREDGGERIEGRGAPLEVGGTWFETAREVRITAGSDLHEEGVEPVLARRSDERRDGFG